MESSSEKFVHFWCKINIWSFQRVVENVIFLPTVKSCYDFGYLEVQTEFQKSKLLDGDLGKDLSTVNLQAEFQKFLFGYLEVVAAPAN